MRVPNNVITIEGKKVKLSNLEKVFYPVSHFTKKQVIDYYIRIAPYILPHLEGRPLTLKRYPNGASQSFFYQKECPSSRPPWLATAPIWSQTNKKHTNFCLIEDLPSLIWTSNLAALELHTPLALADSITCPSTVVFDLDPGAPATILQCVEVGLLLRESLLALGLKSYPKTSGSKGLQIYVPLNTPIDYHQTKKFAHSLALTLENQHPELVVSNMRKSLREGKVFVDWSQNDEHKTTVCVYSLRAKENPSVSTPVAWSEIMTAWQKKNPELLLFSPAQVLERVRKTGDLFQSVLTTKQTLPPQ